MKSGYLSKLPRMLKGIWAVFRVLDFKSFFQFALLIFFNIRSVFRDKNLGVPSKKMWGRPCRFRVFGKEILLDGKYLGYASEIYARKVYFALPNFRLKDGDMVVDLGADGGVFSILAAKFASRVIAVEAQKDSISELKRNAELNNCLDRINVILVVVGPRSGVVKDNPQFRDISVLEMRKLIGDFKKVDFLKIDIEGSEFDLFSKKEDWFSKVHYIAMEVHNSILSDDVVIPGGDIQGIVENLEGAGFDVKLMDIDGRAVNRIEGNAGYLFAKNLKFGQNEGE